MSMTHHEALEVVARHRRDCVVVTTMTSVGIWPGLSDKPLDFAYMPSAMGQAPGIGLGLALARPGRGVIVLNGDGCTLMNLGCLVTLAAHPAAVYLVILDNADWFPNSAKTLREAGLLQVDMHGFGPINDYTWTTSFFFSRDCHLEPLGGLQPHPPIGGLGHRSD